MGSKPLGSRTASLCTPHSADLRGLAALTALSSDSANTITRGGPRSMPCLHPQVNLKHGPPGPLQEGAPAHALPAPQHKLCLSARDAGLLQA